MYLCTSVSLKNTRRGLCNLCSSVYKISSPVGRTNLPRALCTHVGMHRRCGRLTYTTKYTRIIREDIADVPLVHCCPNIFLIFNCNLLYINFVYLQIVRGGFVLLNFFINLCV